LIFAQLRRFEDVRHKGEKAKELLNQKIIAATTFTAQMMRDMEVALSDMEAAAYTHDVL